ncbi:MAG TPA: protein kinase [Candidatus Angelobacter sp.]|nr:protein kinase [Candidatus Angelobacter sp.]
MAPGTVSRIGKYEITGILGRGGMGVVYHAEDKRIGREVAIKTLTEGYAGNPEMLERFYREAQAGALQHQNIVIVYDVGDQDGVPYIVMEFIRGDSLEKIITNRPQLALLDKLDIIGQVCNALNYAHQKGIVHRDIKPANVMVQTDGVVKLVDFGIARQEKSGADRQSTLTRMGNVIGSLSYIAPERFKNLPAGGPSDIFSTGVVLYQFLSGGVLPFEGADDYAVAHQIVNAPYAPLAKHLPQYPADLDRILDRSLAKTPDDRYATAAEMAADLFALKDSLKGHRIVELFTQAQTLAANSELDRARDALLQVVKLDAQHTAAKSLLKDVQQNLSKLQRTDQLRQLRLRADTAVEQKMYPEAIYALQQAIKLDPENNELISLLQTVTETLQRKEQLETLIKEAEAARYAGDLHSALEVASRAIKVDSNDTHAKAIYAAISRDAADRTETLQKAKEAVAAKEFTKAVRLLEMLQSQSAASTEVRDLLEFARREGASRERKQQVDAASAQGGQFLAQGDFAKAIELLESTLNRWPDQGLTVLLQQARNQFEELGRKTAIVLKQANEALGLGKNAEALELLKSQPASFLQIAAFREGAEKLRERISRDEAIGVEIQKARAAFQIEDINQGWQILQSAYQAFGDSEFLKQAANDLNAQRQTIARNRLRNAIQQARELLLKQRYQQAVDALRVVTTFVQHAPADIQAEWQRLGNEAAANLPSTPQQPVSGDAALAVGPARAPLAAQTKVPKTRLWIVLAAAGILAVVALALWLRLSSSPAATPTYVEINASPWGAVGQVIPQKGNPIVVDEKTPVRVNVPSGAITIKIKGPDGAEKLQTCQVSEESHSCTILFTPPPIEDIIRNSK